MAECVVMGAGGGKSEGKFAWKKKEAVAASGATEWTCIRNDGYGQTAITLGNDILIGANGSATLINPHDISTQGSPYLCGYFFGGYGGLYFVNGTAQTITDSNGVPMCCFYAAPVTTSVSLVGFVIDDDQNKYTQTSATPGNFIYEKIT